MNPPSYTLLHHGPAWGLPAACPECIKVMAWLELAVVGFRCQACYNRPDSAELPILEDDTEKGRPQAAYNNEPGGVIEWFVKERGIDLDSSLSTTERTELLAFSSLVDTTLADALQFTLWMENDNYIDARDNFAFHLPFPLRMIMGRRQHQRAQRKFETDKSNFKRVSEEVYGKAAAAYKALAERLGPNFSFYEGRPTSLDALVYSHLVFVTKAELPNNRLKAMVNSHPALVAFTDEMWQRLLQSQNTQRHSSSITPPPFSRTPAPPRSRKEPKPKVKKTAKELAFQKRGRYFIAAQALVAFAFMFFAGVLDIVEEESYEEDGDDGEE